ncbi:MAG: phosphoribosyltransferase family protein [Bacteroidota bacterium]|nr:phosphoribosyltransferase family protein [Bacteroidota bacterium]
MTKSIQILNKTQVEQKLNRLAWQIYENNLEEEYIVIIGIEKRGVILARKIMKYLKEISSLKITLGVIKFDKSNPYESEVELSLKEDEFLNQVVILIDDVLNSGQTLMYATKYFLDTPLRKISTVVLIDRNHNRYPIKADFKGLSLSTTLQEYITVKLSSKDIGVYLA